MRAACPLPREAVAWSLLRESAAERRREIATARNLARDHIGAPKHGTCGIRGVRDDLRRGYAEASQRERDLELARCARGAEKAIVANRAEQAAVSRPTHDHAIAARERDRVRNAAAGERRCASAWCSANS